jgi:SAM-dependent methyltransferase
MNAISYRVDWARRVGPSGIARRLFYRTMRAVRRLDFKGEDNQRIGIERAVGREHAATGIADMIEAFDALGLRGNVRSVLDIGCGKGAALIAFQRLGIASISGVELSKKMFEVCKQNLARMRIAADVGLKDATEVFDFSGFDLIYNFNALPRVPLAKVLDNIATSSRRTRMPLLILFANFQAADRDLLTMPGLILLQRVQRTTEYLLFQFNPA